MQIKIWGAITFFDVMTSLESVIGWHLIDSGTRKNYLSLCVKIQFDEEKWSREIFWTNRGAAKKITVKTTHFVSAKFGVWTSKKCFLGLLEMEWKFGCFWSFSFFCGKTPESSVKLGVGSLRFFQNFKQSVKFLCFFWQFPLNGM